MSEEYVMTGIPGNCSQVGGADGRKIRAAGMRAMVTDQKHFHEIVIRCLNSA